MDGAVELADMIEQLRHDLSTAMHEGDGKDLRFEAGEVELELTVGVERSLKPGVKVRLWVFEAGASAQASSAVTQRIKLTLKPRAAADPKRPALIAGKAVENER